MTRSVPNYAAVKQLDDADILEGYQSGLAGEPEPGNNRSDGVWHGWRNGACDRGLRESDPEQRLIAHEYLEEQRFLQELKNQRASRGQR